MKTFLLASLALAALCLSGCGTANTASFTDFAKQVASDPRCGHTDRVQGNLGGMGGNNLSVFLERTCPPQAAPTTPPAP